MGTNIVFLDWKNQYCQNEYITQGNLGINEIFIKLPMVVFTEIEEKKIICMGTLKPPNSQRSLEKEKWSQSVASDYTEKLW